MNQYTKIITVCDQILNTIKNCGSGGAGSPGFQPGNTCARGGGGGGGLAKFGKMITPGNVSITGPYASEEERNEAFMEIAGSMLKTKPKNQQEAVSALASLAGAPDGADVSIGLGSKGPTPSINIKFTSEIASGERFMIKRSGGLDITNENFTVRSDQRGKGVGAKMLAQQVAHARAQGVNRILTLAAGDAKSTSPLNGAYTWARLGYDGKLMLASPGAKKRLEATVAEGTHPATPQLKKILDNKMSNISDFMKTPETRQWWKENFSGWSGQFDPSEGSVSSRALESYIEEKGL